MNDGSVVYLVMGAITLFLFCTVIGAFFDDPKPEHVMGAIIGAILWPAALTIVVGFGIGLYINGMMETKS